MGLPRIALDMTRWNGRVDAVEGISGRRWHQIVRPLDRQTEGIALIGFASDAGVERNHGRLGAASGPAALRAMLANLPVRGCESIFDIGDVECANSDSLETAQDELSECVAELLGQGLLPIALGGGHEIAYGTYGGLARYLAGQAQPRIGIVNLDAHFDLRADERATSGTPFRQIAEDCAKRGWPFHYCCLGVSEYANTFALFERAKALGVTWLRDEDIDSDRLDDTFAVVEHFVCSVDHVYLTICLDVLPAAVAPGVSAPAPRGVALSVIEAVVDRIVACGKLRVADIAELNPCFDFDGHTARVAARLVARLVEAVWQTRTAPADSSE